MALFGGVDQILPDLTPGEFAKAAEATATMNKLKALRNLDLNTAEGQQGAFGAFVRAGDPQGAGVLSDANFNNDIRKNVLPLAVNQLQRLQQKQGGQSSVAPAEAPKANPEAVSYLNGQIANDFKAIRALPAEQRDAAARAAAAKYEEHGIKMDDLEEHFGKLNDDAWLDDKIALHTEAAQGRAPAAAQVAPVAAPAAVAPVAAGRPGEEYLDPDYASTMGLVKGVTGGKIDMTGGIEAARYANAPKQAADVAKATAEADMDARGVEVERPDGSKHRVSRELFQEGVRQGLWASPSIEQQQLLASANSPTEVTTAGNGTAIVTRREARPDLYGQGAVQSAPLDAAGQQPRGIRNNNPGNIEDGAFAKSLPGYAGSDGRFAKFNTPEQGQAAGASLLASKNYINLPTTQAVINRWAPASDGNDTKAYAAYVAGKLGVKPGDKIDLSNPQVRQKMASAIFEFENGTGSASSGVAPAPAPATGPGAFKVKLGPQERPGPTDVSGNADFNKSMSLYDDPSFDSKQSSVQATGMRIKGLAENTRGPLTPMIGQLKNWAQALGIPVKNGSDVHQLASDLALGSVQAIKGQGISNQSEYEHASQAVGALTDPKDKLIFAGANMAALADYNAKKKAAFEKYADDRSGYSTGRGAEQYWKSTPEGKAGIYGSDAWKGVKVGGKDYVTTWKDPKDGKQYYIVGAGLGRYGMQTIPK